MPKGELCQKLTGNNTSTQRNASPSNADFAPKTRLKHIQETDRLVQLALRAHQQWATSVDKQRGEYKQAIRSASVGLASVLETTTKRLRSVSPLLPGDNDAMEYISALETLQERISSPPVPPPYPRDSVHAALKAVILSQTWWISYLQSLPRFVERVRASHVFLSRHESLPDDLKQLNGKAQDLRKRRRKSQRAYEDDKEDAEDEDDSEQLQALELQHSEREPMSPME